MFSRATMVGCALLFLQNVLGIYPMSARAAEPPYDPFKRCDGDPFGETSAPREPGEIEPLPEPLRSEFDRREAKPPNKKNTQLDGDARTTPIAKPLDRHAIEARIRAALAGGTTFDFQDTPLIEAIDFLREYHKVEMILDKKALEEAGIERTEPVTIRLNNVTLGSGLRHLLRPLDLTYIVRDEALVITTPETDCGHLTVCVYEAGDLVSVGRDLGADKAKSATAKSDDILAQLIEAITACVEPNSWSDAGGPGAVRPMQRLLVINQTEKVHAKIADLLTKLRKVRHEGR
ncbi:MAG: hypothetical protein MI757_06325 [Pirellulales bacterium]|nr:hypothetical protein [Pirellulales bacterium]